jgi:predicted  nucleic acid-binding Zn-ribbon protein
MAAKSDSLLNARNELKDGIENLRKLLREISNAFVAHAESEIAAVSGTIRDLPNPQGGSKAARRQEKLLNEMQKLVGGLKVKPEKGRLKDLRRVRDVLDELSGLAQRFAK